MNEINLLLNQLYQQMLHINWYSKSTIKTMDSTFKIFFKDNNINALKDVNRDIIEEWLINWRINKNWKPATYISYHKHLNNFFKWLEKKWKIEANYMKYIDKPKLNNSLPRRLTKPQAENILICIKKMKYRYKFEIIRNYTIVATLLFTWLRKSEIVNLKISDVDLDRMIITVFQGKWKKDRLVPISSRLYSIFQEYITERKRLNKTIESFFVTSQYNLPIWSKCIDRLINYIRNKTWYNFSTHSLRHTFATLMLEWWCDIYTLSKIMWHSKITTTTIYLACSSQMMLKNIEKHPLN